MRVLLCYKCSEDGRSDFFERILPVGLCTLAAALRGAGHQVDLANFSRDGWRAIARRIAASAADVVGVSTFTFNRHASMRLAREARSALPRCRILLGGPHATHQYAQILADNPAVDFVIIGEGERSTVELLSALARGADPAGVRGIAFAGAGGTRHTGWPEPIEDLDSIPVPVEGFAAHGVDARTQLMYMITSRGCPARCTFCNTPEFWGTKIRFRSVDHVLAEMRALRASFGLLYLSIRDDTFTAHRRRVLELCERMRDERLYFLWDCQSRVNAVDEERLIAMRRAGCVHIQYGVESGSPRILARLAKDIGPEQIEAAARWTRRAGLVFSVYLISGTPGEDDADVAATEALLARIRPHDVMVSPLAVFPGTALWSGMKAAGRLGEGIWGAGSREDVYVRAGDPTAEAHLRRLGAAAERAAARNAFTVRDYAAHRRRVGDCHAMDLSEADLHAGEGRSGDAVRVLTGLARREPENPWAQLRLGQIHLAGRRFARAADHLEELTRIVPRFAEGHALLGRALGRLRRESAAATALTAALRLDPLHAAARRSLRRLGAVEASAPVGPRPSTPSTLLRA